MIQNKNNENPSQKLNLLSGNMLVYIVRLLVWAVEGGNKVSLHPVHIDTSGWYTFSDLDLENSQQKKVLGSINK